MSDATPTPPFVVHHTCASVAWESVKWQESGAGDFGVQRETEDLCYIRFEEEDHLVTWGPVEGGAGTLLVDEFVETFMIIL